MVWGKVRRLICLRLPWPHGTEQGRLRHHSLAPLRARKNWSMMSMPLIASMPLLIEAKEPVKVDTLPIGKLDNIRLPPTVAPELCAHAVEVAMKFNQHEGKPTGCLLVLGNPEELVDLIQPMSQEHSSLVGKRIQDPGIEGPLRKSFAEDGCMVIDGQSGEILAANCMVRCPEKSPYVFSGHGTRHHAALHLTAKFPGVAITRSQEGYVTVFSSGHLQDRQTPTCFRVERREEIVEVNSSQMIRFGGASHRRLQRRSTSESAEELSYKSSRKHHVQAEPHFCEEGFHLVLGRAVQDLWLNEFQMRSDELIRHTNDMEFQMRQMPHDEVRREIELQMHRAELRYHRLRCVELEFRLHQQMRRGCIERRHEIIEIERIERMISIFQWDSLFWSRPIANISKFQVREGRSVCH